MHSIRFLLLIIFIINFASCATNKNTTNSNPPAREQVSENMVPGSVLADMTIVSKQQSNSDDILSVQIVNVIKNGPQSPILNRGQRIDVYVNSPELKSDIPNYGEQIRAMIISNEIIQVGMEPTLKWQLVELIKE